MTQPQPRQGPSLIGLLLAVFFVGVLAFAALETLTQQLLAAQGQGSSPPSHLRALLPLLNRYLRLRYALLANVGTVIFWTPVGLSTLLLFLAALKRLAAAHNRWRTSKSRMKFQGETYNLKELRVTPDAALDLVRANPIPHEQVLLGLDASGQPVFLSDRARSMHVHVLGQTGSGKTKSVIEPLLLQDIWRGSGVLLVGGKGPRRTRSDSCPLRRLAIA